MAVVSQRGNGRKVSHYLSTFPWADLSFHRRIAMASLAAQGGYRTRWLPRRWLPRKVVTTQGGYRAMWLPLKVVTAEGGVN